MKVKKVALFFVYNIIVAFLILFLIELGFIFLLNHPRSIPKKYFGQFKKYYNLVDRNIIQLQEEFAAYHPDLFYTLQPGDFIFENREFSNLFSVNS